MRRSFAGARAPQDDRDRSGELTVSRFVQTSLREDLEDDAVGRRLALGFPVQDLLNCGSVLDRQLGQPVEHEVM